MWAIPRRCCWPCDHRYPLFVRLCCPVPDTMQCTRMPDRTRGWIGHRTVALVRSLPIGAAWFEFPVPAPPHQFALATMRPYSPTTSRYFSPNTANLLLPFAMWSAFPTSDYYESSAPIWDHRRTARLPCFGCNSRSVGPSQIGSHVHHVIVRRGRCPAFPLQSRCKYAAGFPCSLHVDGYHAFMKSHASQADTRALLTSPYPPDLS